ncbi:MAG TPA: VIT1/CCC1 transporter family protein [Candidatus Dormibacteraeota bacterium]|nr:VIT1/CCC1 transporter family protein [Candidatus Dormibacteraeota bacterium]
MALALIARARTRIKRGSRVRELVFGLQDALLATVGLVAGVDGATRQNSRVVIFAGLSHLVAGAVSMGAGEYLSSAAQQRVTAAAATTLFQATAIGISDAGAGPARREAVLGALVMAGSFAVGAILPVLPYFFTGGALALILSIAIATTAIFAVGAAIGRLSEDNPLRAAAEFSVIALGAGGIGYAAGLVISAIAGQRVSGGS